MPRVLATGADPRLPGGHWFATAKVEGANWSIDDPASATRIVPDIACCLAALHRVRPKGFGPLDADGQGTDVSWPAWVLRSVRADLDSLVESGHTTDAFRTKAIEVFEHATPTIERGSLLQADLGEGNTFVDPERGVVTGILDFGSSVVGDPVYELAKVAAGGPGNDPRTMLVLPTLLERYIAEADIDRVRVDCVLPLYRAHNAILNAEWSRREGIPWTEGLLTAADAWLRAVVWR